MQYMAINKAQAVPENIQTSRVDLVFNTFGDYIYLYNTFGVSFSLWVSNDAGQDYSFNVPDIPIPIILPLRHRGNIGVQRIGVNVPTSGSCAIASINSGAAFRGY